MTLEADTPVQYVPGVGPRRARLLEKLEIRQAKDFLFHVPRRYEEYQPVSSISQLYEGGRFIFKARVFHLQLRKPRPGLTLLEAVLGDGSGQVMAVWFNQPYLREKLQVNGEYLFRGEVKRHGRWLQAVHPEVGDGEGAFPSILPVYPSAGGISQKLWLRWTEAALPLARGMEDHLPPELEASAGGLTYAQALQAIHRPRRGEEAEKARKRLALSELFYLQLGLGLFRHQVRSSRRQLVYRPEGFLAKRFREILPFTLTQAQEKAMAEIERDLLSPHPMNRLLQGDVGSGKTVVLTWALLRAVENGYQAAIMAPTEILAYQHWQRMEAWFTQLKVPALLLVGAQKPSEKRIAYRALKEGHAAVAIGTHALLQEGVEFQRLGLVVTDEQHRFGVRQRLALLSKGEEPDLLVASATPIPRSLALVAYGDLDLSVMDEMPRGRQPVRTLWRPSRLRPKIYQWLYDRVRAGERAYIICPLVEEGEGDQKEAAAAEVWWEKVKREAPDIPSGLLHGRLTNQEKMAAMEAFARGEIRILVATTVVEVGIDVPEATLMIIEGAERFGLAQLHQLRGRIGRGKDPSTCVLIGDPKSEVAKERLEVLTREQNGFRIAEEDLRLRGPGEMLGTRQHGVPELRFADLVRDQELLHRAREAARAILAEDPHLSAPDKEPLRRRLEEVFGDTLGRALLH